MKRGRHNQYDCAHDESERATVTDQRGKTYDRCRGCERERKRKHRAENVERYRVLGRSRQSPARRRDGHLRRTYGITLEAEISMLEAQSYECAVCSASLALGHNVDHDHETGAVRAMLCGSCNSSLGHAKDSPELLYRLAEYIEQHQGTALVTDR